MVKHYSEFVKGKIIGFCKVGLSLRNIGKEMSIPYSSVKGIVDKYLKTGSVIRIPGSGRRPLLNEHAQTILCNISNKNPRKNATILRKEIEKITNVKASNKTIIRNLNKHKIYARIAKKKPFISTKNKKLRFELARKFLGLSDEYWKSVIFSDESSFELFPTKKHQIIYRKDGTAYEEKNLVPTVKFGGQKIMVWGCISHKGVGNLVFIAEKINSGVYINTLVNNRKQSAEKMCLDKFIFQQDGAPSHTSKATKKYFEKNNIQLLEWAAQSPDLNPIEHVWYFIKQELLKYSFKNLNELREKILEIWNSILLDFIRNL